MLLAAHGRAIKDSELYQAIFLWRVIFFCACPAIINLQNILGLYRPSDWFSTKNIAENYLPSVQLWYSTLFSSIFWLCMVFCRADHNMSSDENFINPFTLLVFKHNKIQKLTKHLDRGQVYTQFL